MFKLYPTIKIEERYEDNIFLLPAKEDDTVTTITPGFSLKGKCRGEDIAELDYKYNRVYYNKVVDKSVETNDVTAKVKFAGEDHSLLLEERFRTVTQPNSYVAEFIDYDFNTATLTFSGDYDKFLYDISLKNEDYEYQEIDSTNSYNKLTAGAIGYYRFLPKTKWLFEYKAGALRYDNDGKKNGRENIAVTGIEGKLSQRITGTVKFGYEYVDYKDSQDKRDVYIDGQAAYALSKKTKIDIGAERKVLESAYTADNSYYKNRVSCKLSQNIFPKSAISLTASYDRDRYPTSKRRDDIWDVKLALDINTRKWLVSGISHQFKERDSNVQSYDYRGNITSAYIKVSY